MAIGRPQPPAKGLYANDTDSDDAEDDVGTTYGGGNVADYTSMLKVCMSAVMIGCMILVGILLLSGMPIPSLSEWPSDFLFWLRIPQQTPTGAVNHPLATHAQPHAVMIVATHERHLFPPQPSPHPPPPPPTPLPPAPPPPPPPLPPLLPPSPFPPPPGGAAADRLNARFRLGRPANDLPSIGVMLHQFDQTEHPDMPWRPCPQFCNGIGQVCGCAFLRDRLACSVAFAGMPKVGTESRIPLFSDKLGGMILSPNPAFNRIFCAFPGDAGSRARVCNPPGPSDSCTPGCTDKWHPWCDASRPDVWCDGNPWSPNMLSLMLEAYRHRPAPYASHNEFVIDAQFLDTHLPHSVEAFFYPLTEDCDERCSQQVRRAHADFLQVHAASEAVVPLLALRIDNWDEPFIVAPPISTDSFQVWSP